MMLDAETLHNSEAVRREEPGGGGGGAIEGG